MNVELNRREALQIIAALDGMIAQRPDDEGWRALKDKIMDSYRSACPPRGVPNAQGGRR